MAWSGRRSIAYRFLAMYMSCESTRVSADEHDSRMQDLRARPTHRHTGHFSQPSPELPIARRDDVTPMLGHSVHDAVVGVGALVRAGQALETRIPGDSVREWKGGQGLSSVSGKPCTTISVSGTYRRASLY